MKILIICAMKSELEGFLNQLDYDIVFINGFTCYKATIEDKEIYMAKSEVGKVNSAVLTALLINKIKPRYIINAGIAGALNANLDVLDVVCATKVAYHDFDLTAFGLPMGQLDEHDLYFKTSKKLQDCCPDFVKKGLIVSGDQFMSKKEQLDHIKQYFPKALACDMEGASIIHTSEILKRKAIVIRSISDNVYKLNQVEDYKDNKQLAIEKVVMVTLDLIRNL